MPLAEGATFAGYTIVRPLGSGGMGEFYLAQHPRLPRRDALKVLPATVSADADYRERFHQEADIAATLRHPHIVGVHGRRECDGQIWISMDYVDHQHNLLHRDVKAANILLPRPGSGEQRIRLADFGIARWVKDISGLCAEESPVRVCTQQTGMARRECREEIRRSNGLPFP